MIAPEGPHEGIAVETAFEQAKTGNICIKVSFRLNEKFGGTVQYTTWQGWFTEGTTERTIEALRAMGWQGNDIDELGGLNADECQRLIPNTVSLVTYHEEWEKDGKPRSASRVKFVNKAFRQGNLVSDKRRADPSEVSALSRRLRGVCAQTKADVPPPTNDAADPTDLDDDFDFPAF